MKKLLLIAILMLALVITAAACTDDPVEPGTSGAEVTTAETPTEAPSQEPDETPEPEVTTEEPDEPTTPEPEVTTAEPEVTTDEPETEDPMAPVNMFDHTAVGNVVDPGKDMKNGTVSLEDGYVHIVPGGRDPFWFPFRGVDGARFVAIRYRTADAVGADIQFFMASTGNDPTDDSSMLQQPIVADGEWHLAVFDTQPLIDAGIYNGSYVSYFRFDPLEAGYMLDENGQPYKDEDDRWVKYELPAGCSLDVAYIAFFDSAEAAEKYDAEKYPTTDEPETPIYNPYTANETINWTPNGITVDGDFADWNGLNVTTIPVDKFVSWVGSPAETFSMVTGFAADSDYLYGVIFVADDTVVSGNKVTDGYNGDVLQVAITLNGGKQAWYSFSYKAEGENYIINTANKVTEGAELATVTAEGGWLAEIKLPISVLFADAGVKEFTFDAENPWTMEVLVCNLDRDANADDLASAVGTFVGTEAWKDNGFALTLNWADGMALNTGIVPVDPMAPVNVFKAEDISHMKGQKWIASAELIGDYLHIVPSKSDPNWLPFAQVNGARFVAIRYRSSDATGANTQFFMGSTGNGPTNDSSMLQKPIVVDGQWNLIVFDTQSLIDAGIYDGEYVSYFRFDPLEAGYVLDENGEPYKDASGNWVRNSLPAGCSIDIAYIGFFHSVEAAEKYDAEVVMLPEEPEVPDEPDEPEWTEPEDIPYEAIDTPVINAGADKVVHGYNANGTFSFTEDSARCEKNGSMFLVSNDRLSSGKITATLTAPAQFENDNGIVFGMADNTEKYFFWEDGPAYYFLFVADNGALYLSKVAYNGNPWHPLLITEPIAGYKHGDTITITVEFDGAGTIDCYANGVCLISVFDPEWIGGARYGLRCETAGVTFSEITVEHK